MKPKIIFIPLPSNEGGAHCITVSVTSTEKAARISRVLLREYLLLRHISVDIRFMIRTSKTGNV